MEMRRFAWVAVLGLVLLMAGTAQAQEEEKFEYLLLATKKTSTMQKEMNQAAEQGYHFGGVMGGETSFGGNEVVVIMERAAGTRGGGRFHYILQATQKTSTMQKELQQAGNEGYEYKGQTVFETSFGGKEVVVILERDREQKEIPVYEYKLLATKKTGTTPKELSEVAAQGFRFVGVTVSETSFGGREVVTITRRVKK
jgi:hypothetical protein